MEEIAALRIRTPPCDSDSDAEESYRKRILKKRVQRCAARTLYTVAFGFALYTFLGYHTTDYKLFQVILYLLLSTGTSALFVVAGVKVCVTLGWCKAQEGSAAAAVAGESKKEDDLEPVYTV